jgi:hypothetical protein
MTFDERVQAVAKKGFTQRQARFLTTVMLHTGVCVPRQYARFCGIVYGEKTRKFFAKLVRLEFASMYDCRHNRARIYHLNQRALYATIGEADSRLRKPVTLNHAIQRLMVTSRIVCRSAFISPAAALSCTSSPNPGWTSSGYSSNGTPRCSERCRHGRSGSSCRHSSRTSLNGPGRSYGTN